MSTAELGCWLQSACLGARPASPCNIRWPAAAGRAPGGQTEPAGPPGGLQLVGPRACATAAAGHRPVAGAGCCAPAGTQHNLVQTVHQHMLPLGAVAPAAAGQRPVVGTGPGRQRVCGSLCSLAGLCGRPGAATCRAADTAWNSCTATCGSGYCHKFSRRKSLWPP